VTKEQERKALIEGGDNAMEEYKQSFVKGASNFSNYFGKTIKGVLGGAQDASKLPEKKKQTMRIHKTLAQNIIFNTISNFLFHFINFKYSLENSREVILFFCKRYELDQSRTHLLLSELQSA